MRAAPAPTIGSFCWVELATTDPAAATKFYGPVLGWWFKEGEVPGGGGPYLTAKLDDDDIGGVWALTERMRERHDAPHWLPYLAVEDVDAAVDRLKSGGGTVLNGPVSMEDVGHFAIVRDPQGAILALFQSEGHPGCLRRDGSPGTTAWVELWSPDRAASVRFYEELIDWEPQEMEIDGMGYTSFRRGDEWMAGAGSLEEFGVSGLPPHWLVYFSVADCDRAVKEAETRGGRTLVPPKDSEPGRFAILTDPQGAPFGVITPKRD